MKPITGRENVAVALLRQETELQVLFDLMPAMIWFKDTKNGILRVNRRVAEAAGKSVAEIEGRPTLEIYPQDAARFYADDMEVIRSRAPKLGIVETLQGPDGEKHWVQTDKVPYFDRDGNVIGIVVMAQDITAHKRAHQALRESERRFSDVLGNIELASLMLDRDARITYCNDYLLHLTGWQHAEVIGRNWFELFIPPELQYLKGQFFSGLLANQPETRHHENEIVTHSGERRLIRWNNSMLRSATGEVIGTASIGEDITEQKRSEFRIRRLNRVYTVLSGINALITRVHDRDVLFREACRIAVDLGQFKVASVAVVDRGSAQVRPVASAGASEEFLAMLRPRFSLSDGAPGGPGAVAQAVRDKKPVVINDVQSDPLIALRKECSERGICSIAVLPLVVSGEAVAVLALCSGDTGFFDQQEMKLLTELAGDIAFAIDHIGKQEKLDYLAYYDALTGLANRTLFHERLEQGVLHAREQGRRIALVLMDIERFKTINDTHGREAGDALLKQLAARMLKYTVDAARLGRIDADHFAVMISDLQTEQEVARRIEQRYAEMLAQPFHAGDSELRISVRFGIAMFPADGSDADTLFRNAEAALKKAKAGGERYLFYTQSMNERVAEKLSLENRLRQAIDRGEFVLHYQPKGSFASGKLTSAEALIRWNDPQGGLVPPGQFIPVLEETGLINQVGRWALQQAIADYLRWCNAGLAAVRIAVNVSPLQLRSQTFAAEIEQAIGIDPRAPGGLELEITESLIMEDVRRSIASLQAIRAMGVTIAIDDFGTGFSSLSYLAKLPVDALKIDRSFVIDMTTGPQGLALVATIINLAHSLKLKVVAEGVETEDQSRVLRLLGCDEMQGFLFSKPLPADVFEARFLTATAGLTHV
jgi:diguanylate cyclase (GGDEF)-like protein/PAS domain S-box-containing protein